MLQVITINPRHTCSKVQTPTVHSLTASTVVITVQLILNMVPTALWVTALMARIIVIGMVQIDQCSMMRDDRMNSTATNTTTAITKVIIVATENLACMVGRNSNIPMNIHLLLVMLHFQAETDLVDLAQLNLTMPLNQARWVPTTSRATCLTLSDERLLVLDSRSIARTVATRILLSQPDQVHLSKATDQVQRQILWVDSNRAASHTHKVANKRSAAHTLNTADLELRTTNIRVTAVTDQTVHLLGMAQLTDEVGQVSMAVVDSTRSAASLNILSCENSGLRQ